MNLILALVLMFSSYAYDGINSHQWKHRVLLIKAQDKADLLLMSQDIMQQKDELTDRDMVIYGVDNDETHCLFGPCSDDISKDEIDAYFDPDETETQFVLLGKDGGVKLEQKSSLNASEVFDLIDSMPMRINEMNSSETD
jgi:hypothetical protein